MIYSQRSKLFVFDKDVKQWKERGIGEMKLLKHRLTGKSPTRPLQKCPRQRINYVYYLLVKDICLQISAYYLMM